MSSTLFEPEGSSSGRRLCIQLWYGTVCCAGISISSLFKHTLLYNRIIIGEGYKSLSSSFCSFLQSPVTSSLSDPNIPLNTLFTNTLSLLSSLKRTTKFQKIKKSRNTRVITPVILYGCHTWALKLKENLPVPSNRFKKLNGI
jgi:hypothetical protein